LPENRNGRLPCCTADNGSRYFGLADDIGAQSLKDSICLSSFRDTMIDIAQFVASQDSVNLAEAPADPKAIVVSVRRAGAAEDEILQQVGDCATESGYQIDGKVVRFCGAAVPKSGDDVKVQALGARAQVDAGPDGNQEAVKCELPPEDRVDFVP
jgi:hypothetical protein